jgi:hypothetical protein
VALSEAQIVRYGRQILLREVGGRGQARLLERPVLLEGANAATEVAAAYLAAGGTPLVGAPPPTGFFAGTALDGFSPDATSSGSPFAALASAGVLPSLPTGLVVGGDGLAFTEGGCPACLAATAATLARDVGPVEAVLLGGLAALTLQRLALGLPGAGAVRCLRLTAGGPAAAAPVACPEHAPGQ